MRYPPAISITPAASRVYRVAAALIAIILIALYAGFITANGLFNLKSSVLATLALLISLWLMWDAWLIWLLPHRAGKEQLHFAEGLWTLQRGDAQIPGTLRLHFDLQRYMLVSFATCSQTHPNTTGFFRITTQWFHLEARQLDPATSFLSWSALRRAVFAAAEPVHEERIA